MTSSLIRVQAPASSLAVAATAGATLTLTASVALAQSTAQIENELPPVVVQGGTIAVKSVAQPAAKSAPASGGEGGTASASRSAQAGGSAGEDGSASAAAAVEPGQLLSSQGNAVSVVTGDDLRRQQVRHVADALRSLPGVSVSRTGGNAGLTQVRIRGAEGNQTVVIIDGIEANQSGDGEFDFSNLLADDIDRIEVLRGVQSGLYGSGAIGGVINIVTRSGKGPLTLRTRAEAGSFNTRDVAFSVSGGNERLHGVVGLAKRRTDGFNIAPQGGEDDGNEIAAFHAKFGVEVFKNLNLQGVIRHTSKSGDRDDENLSLAPGVPAPQFDSASVFASKVWLYALEGKLALADGKWLHSLRADRNQTRNNDLLASPFFAPSTFFEDYEAARDRFRYTSTYEIAVAPAVRHFVTGLVEHAEETFTVFTADAIERREKRLSFAGEVRGEYWNTMFLTASVRHDDSNEYDSFTTWRTTGSALVPGTPLRFHASAGTGIKYPSLFERFGRFPPFFVPNPDLVPEEAIGWDAGAEVTLWGRRAMLDVTYFETELENKITGLFAPVNLAGTSSRKGVEVTGTAIVMPGLTVSASYTHLLAEELPGQKEIRRPENSGRIDVNYSFDGGRGQLTLSGLYNGEIQDEAIDVFFSPLRVTLDDYWLARVSASYAVAPGVELYGRIENVLDADYQEVFGFETAGIAAYAGVRLTYEDLSTLEWSRRR